MTTVLDLVLVISTYFNHVNGAKWLIHIKLCTESDLFMYLKEKQYKIAMLLLCPVQGPWASSYVFMTEIYHLQIKERNLICTFIKVLS